MRNAFRIFAPAICVLAVGLLDLLPADSQARAEPDELAQLGLPPDAGRDEVEAYCGACHSLKLVVQQGLSRADWEEVLVWMIEEQEMEPLEPVEHELVIDYLAKHVSVEVMRQKRKR